MFTEVTAYDFQYAFNKLRANSFTPVALRALYDYLCEYEDSTGERLELDVIAICCDWSEYDDLQDVQADWSDIESLEDLNDRTTVIQVPDTRRLIVESF